MEFKALEIRRLLRGDSIRGEGIANTNRSKTLEELSGERIVLPRAGEAQNLISASGMPRSQWYDHSRWRERHSMASFIM
jgi:hypothetical protein